MLSRPPRRIRAVPAAAAASKGPRRWVSPTATYIICTNPRSGSWLLSEGLAATSIAGNPREWFNVQQEQATRAQWRIDNDTDLTFEGYVEAARLLSTSSNGVSGIKLHYYQFADLPRRMPARPGGGEPSPGELLTALFPDARYVWLTRRDKVRQAISLFLAHRTDHWWSVDGSPAREEPAIEFDPDAIAAFQALLEKSEHGWQSFFEANRITPLAIEYEGLAADYAGTIGKVLQWLGIPDAARPAMQAPRLRRQSDARGPEWAARIAASNAGRPDLSAAAPVRPADPRVFGRLTKPFASIPDLWRQWVAHARLRGYGADAIAEVLIGNGYSAAAAHAEAGKAVSDPYLLAGARHLQALNKAAALLDAQARLRRLDPRADVVERRDPMPADEFRDRYYASNRPVVIRDLLGRWTASTGWTPDYLKKAAGHSTVEVMTGRSADPRYDINARRHRTHMRFDAFIDMVYSGRLTNDYCLTESNLFFQNPGTAALLDDLKPLPQYLSPRVDGRRCFLWFGPAGVVTRLHHDTMNVLIAQVAGRKRFRLVAPQHLQNVYNTAGVFSDVDCEAPDLARHPKFRRVGMADIILEPGETLFMPVGWWRHARALDVSMTVTFTNFIFPNRFTWEQRP
jgi:LPS sulfotransferase NodH